MGILASIGDRFEKEERQVEKDLLGYLEYFRSGSVIDLESDYKRALRGVLENKELIENYDHFTYIITPRGITTLERGWVIRDFQPIEKEERRIKRRDNINLLIALAGVVVGAFGLIFPRQEIPKTHPELIEFTVMSPSMPIDSLAQINEINQACDSTSKKDSIKNK